MFFLHASTICKVSLRYPQGRADFREPVLHSGEWDPSLDLRGKTVSVVGTGASAVQVLKFP